MSEQPTIDSPPERKSSHFLDSMLYTKMPVLDHGFVSVVDYMGNQSSIVEAARVSYQDGTQWTSTDMGLIRYLLRHRHSTPFEMCELKLHVKLPIFVARQWIRHRMANVNEVSARYSILAKEFYIPDVDNIQAQSTTNKQGRGEGLSLEDALEAQKSMRWVAESAYDHYEHLLREDSEEPGVARELARTVLPGSIYTEWYWKIDLHNLLHFLSLRADSHAQWEIRQYAELIATTVRQWVPSVWDAFVDYRLNACTFSGPEMKIVREIMARNPSAYQHLLADSHFSKGELAEFKKKLE